MDRRSERLTDEAISQITKPGMYADGNCLYLQVKPTGAKSWVLRYQRCERERWMGLGPVRDVSLPEARSAARNARRELRDGVDPLDKKRKQLERRRSRTMPSMTFDDCVRCYVEDHEAGWRSEKHRAQWRNTLRMYVSPHFGSLNVRKVGTEHVLKALKPIWQTKTVTATRVRERIERVLSWSTVRGLRAADNPARWDGHLEMLLPAPAKLRTTKHHAALPLDQARAFLSQLRGCEGTAARALEFTILTASRTGEVRAARWSEMDLDQGIWTVPAERMKAGRVHRVPLSRAVIELLKRQSRVDATYVFPSAKGGEPMHINALALVLGRLRPDVTVHGFRSTFRDWAAEMTSHPRELAEVALAHTVGSAVENAYRRGDLLERRRRLMEDWSSWCGGNRQSVPLSRNSGTAPVLSASSRWALPMKPEESEYLGDFRPSVPTILYGLGSILSLPDAAIIGTTRSDATEVPG